MERGVDVGSAEEHADAACGQLQIHLKIEAGPRQRETDVELLAHVSTRVSLRRSSASASSTTKLNSSMPPASQWAWLYSMAST